VRFIPVRSRGDTEYAVVEPAVVMVNGRLVIEVGPNELLTLRSVPSG
jgi:hypothetical protein